MRHAERVRAGLIVAILAAGWASIVGTTRPVVQHFELRPPRHEPSNASAGFESAELVFDLHDADESAAEEPRARPAAATPLDDRTADALLARLPAPAVESAPAAPVLSGRSVPVKQVSPPLAKAAEAMAFPPPPAPSAQPASGSLKVERHAPDGELTTARQVSLTFSEPMVGLTAAEAAGASVPASLVPQPAGSWRWLGANTLVFEGRDRLPMATNYVVQVPAATRSLAGRQLPARLRWTFSTTPPALVSFYPDKRTVSFSPVCLAVFDQRIDPVAVLRTIRAAIGGRLLGLRLATAEELRADAGAARLAHEAPAGQWLPFRVDGSVPGGARVAVTIGPGTPSLEGPRTTAAAQRREFQVPGPMQVLEARCSRPDCGPASAVEVAFSNKVDEESFDPKMVEILPPLPNAVVVPFGRGLGISGRFAQRTTYHVWIAPELRDIFGQALGARRMVTFSVGGERSSEQSGVPGGQIIVLPPGTTAVPIRWSGRRGPRVSVYAVRTDDWPRFSAVYNQQLFGSRRFSPVSLPGRLVFQATLSSARPDPANRTLLDLAPFLRHGVGHAVVLVEWSESQRRNLHWVQATRIGLAAVSDHDSVVGWASSLEDGRPLAGVSLSLVSGGAVVATGADGTVRLPATAGEQKESALVARLGEDTVLLPLGVSESDLDLFTTGRRHVYGQDILDYYIFSDRQIYRPGEEAAVKGWVRLEHVSPLSGLDMPGDAVRSVNYEWRDARWQTITRGSAKVNRFGGFDFRLKVPPTAALGSGAILVSAGGDGNDRAEAPIEVQEFRRPEFEVHLDKGAEHVIVGGSGEVTTRATYLSGGPLGAADVHYVAFTQPASFTPPNRSDFLFQEAGGRRSWSTPMPAVHQARTDGRGTHALRLDLHSVRPRRPVSLRIDAQVTDLNRQSVAASTTVVVHPAAACVGLRVPSAAAWGEGEFPVEFIVTDLDGHAIAGRPVELRLTEDGWFPPRRSIETGRATSADGPGRHVFHVREPGTYHVTATVTDAQGRESETEIKQWVLPAGPSLGARSRSTVVDLRADKPEYRPGDVARVTIATSIMPPAEGLLMIEQTGIVRTERFSMTSSPHVLAIPIDARFTPNVWVSVALVGKRAVFAPNGGGGTAARQLVLGGGQLELSVPPAHQRLTLSVQPDRPELEPGGSTAIHVVARDAAGRPAASAEVAVVVVDEAVLSLARERFADPVSAMYQRRPAGTGGGALHGYLLDAPPSIGGRPNGRVVGGIPPFSRTIAMASTGSPPPIPLLRQDFSPLALFEASLVTDAAGRASVPVTLPHSLTRYRVIAVAAAGVRFGMAESTLVARLPLAVRPSPPRFLNVGDHAELPVVVQNLTGATAVADVAVRATNAAFTAGRGRRVRVAAGDRVEVRFPFDAGRAGTARIQVVAASGRWSDASEISLPIHVPAMAESVALYGRLDGAVGSVAHPVEIPRGALPDYGALDVTTSSMALHDLTDAARYLVTYPFDCTEQVASRLLALAALGDVPGAFDASVLPDAAAIGAAATRDIARLGQLQRDDGGFGLWRRDDGGWPFASVHAAHALERARLKGLAVPETTLAAARGYLKSLDRRLPASYPPSARQATLAYALFVRLLSGDADTKRARALVDDAGGVSKLPVEAAAWLLSVLRADRSADPTVAEIRRHLANRVVETAAAAHAATSDHEREYLVFASNARTDAVLLDALVTDQPASGLVPKFVEGLLTRRVAGRWQTTQENAFALLALDRYVRTFEKAVPDFVARTWIGGRFAGEHAFRGRAAGSNAVALPMSAVLDGADRQDVVLAKDGPGRLYYRLGLQYAPRDPNQPSLDRGFFVERVFEAVDAEDDVRRDGEGVWHVRAGARVRVRVSIVSAAERHLVAVVDPLPAGFEAVNPALATTGTLAWAPGQARTWWWDHENLRDDRVEVFAAALPEGAHAYSYICRATTPGTFVVPAPKAEEMYHPETFGRGVAGRVVIDAR